MKKCFVIIVIALAGCGSGYAPIAQGDGGNAAGGPDLRLRCPPEKLEKCPKSAHGAPNTNLCTDVKHCGECFNQCQAPNGVPTCIDAECRMAICNPGFSDCDKFYQNGCETMGPCVDLGAPPDAAPGG